MKNKNQTGLKNFKPKKKLNHNKCIKRLVPKKPAVLQERKNETTIMNGKI